MKKNRFAILTTVFVSLLIIAVSSVLFTSCEELNQEKEAYDIIALEISNDPNKTNYVKGETLDLSGLTVLAISKDGNRYNLYDFTTTPAEGQVLNETGSIEVVVEKVVRKNREKSTYKDSFYIYVN